MILNHSRLIIAHGVDPSAWIAKHGLEPFTHPCGVCEKPRTTSIPCTDGVHAGLMSPKCDREDCPDAPYCCLMPELG